MKKELEVVMVVHIYTTGTCASNFALRYIPSPVNRDNTALTLDIAIVLLSLLIFQYGRSHSFNVYAVSSICSLWDAGLHNSE